MTGTVGFVKFSINVHEKPMHEISPVANLLEKWNAGMME
jgi:hypothetical protein